jgi:ABC-type branched-subunit amino acid transport system ATPase component
MSLLQVTKVSRFFGGLAAVKDVSFEVRQGEILGLIGPNGAGKTTLFNVVNGFYAPSRGEVLFKGERISGLRLQARHGPDLPGREASPAHERHGQCDRLGVPAGS